MVVIRCLKCNKKMNEFVKEHICPVCGVIVWKKCSELSQDAVMKQGRMF